MSTNWNSYIEQIENEKFTPLISNRMILNYLFDGLDVIKHWAEDIAYPLIDSNNFAFVAQYLSVIRKDPLAAKVEYLEFLKRKLLNVPKDEQLNDRRTFSEVATDLGCFNFLKEPDHPLHLLAKLPLPIYLTTSHHSFIEFALEAVGREPQSRVYCWSDTLRQDPPRRLKAYLEDADPSVEEPLVYHLLGIDAVPESLVISEDDFFECLDNVIEDLKQPDQKPWGLPNEVNKKLRLTSLLLLGYSFYDWPFRVAFRGVIKTVHHQKRPRSLLIQFQSGWETGIREKDQVKNYLGKYADDYRFDIYWDADAQNFTQKLWENLPSDSPIIIKQEYHLTIVAVKKCDSSSIYGTGFLVSYESKTFIVTCAHVITNLGKQENDTICLKPLNSDKEQSAMIRWLRVPNSNQKNWNAFEDIAILTLDPPIWSELKGFNVSETPYEDKENCFCFGYIQSKLPRGAWLEGISCGKQVDGGFIQLDQSGKVRIEKGASGAPLSDEQGNILGMLQASDRKGELAYLTPMAKIIEVLQNIIEEDQ